MGRGSIVSVVVTALCVSCAPLHVVSVLPAQRTPGEGAFSAPLTVVTDTRSVHLPLAVAGSTVAYSDLAQALELAVLSQAAPVLGARARDRRFELFLELVEARAEYSSAELIIELTVRATLRDRAGNSYVAQSYARSRVARVTTPELGGPGVAGRACEDVAARVAGWLAGLELERDERTLTKGR